MIKKRTNMLMLTTSLFFFTFTAIGNGQDIRADNTAKYIGDGRYSWTVYIVADKNVLKNIKYVEYTLHPTFDPPVRKVANGNGQYPFALSTSGWGDFTMGVKVVFRDRTSTSFDYQLKLFSNSNKSKR